MNWIRNTFEISHTTHRTVVSMEGIRGFAVFLVFLVHYVILVNPWLSQESSTFVIASLIRRIGNVGVDLFFVLSGFLIYGMLIRKEKPFRGYLFRRIQRIYPTFTAVFVIYLVLSMAFPSESKIPDGWPGAILVIQNYFLLPGLFEIRAIISVAWSLSYEFFYYLLIPLLIASLGMRSWNPVKRITFFLAASILLFGFFAVYGGHSRLLMFVSGILLFDVIENNFVKKLPSIGLPALAIAIGTVIMINESNDNVWWKFAILYALFFVFCLECFVSSGLTARLFSFSPMRWLGNMSYSYYLVHGLALRFVFLVVEKIYPAQNTETWEFWLFLPLAFFLTLIPSALLFIYVEKPYSLVRK